MEFVLAFIVGGCLCGLFQIVMTITKLHPPEMLIIGLAIGAALLPTGILAWLEATGGAGMSIMVLDAGGAIMGSLMSLLHGDPSSFAMLLGIFALLALIGICAGALYQKIHPAGKAE